MVSKAVRQFHRLCGLGIVLLLAFAVSTARAQSTGSLQGTVTDSSGAVVPNATVTVESAATGVTRTVTTGPSGNYQVPALRPGTYKVEASAQGFARTTTTGVVVPVGTTVTTDIKLSVSTTQQTVEVNAQAPVVNETGISVGQVVDQQTVQQAPLNGRHFVDLGALIPGSVAAPANGFLTQPIRGQGALSFDTAGQREDTVNFMINGINLNDMIQNQITFQPEINTVQEFKADNSTFSAEYGRSSGAIVNIATRSGTNKVHGEAYNYLRNQFFDARNYFNRQFTVNGTHVAQSQFIRNQFGGDLGGPLWKDHTFVFGSYEGLRQRQGVAVNTGVPPAGSVGADSTIQKLLALLPAPNSGNSFVGSASALANIDQGTIDVTQTLGLKDQLHGFYAIQQDSRNEPLAPTVADTIPGYGDTRPARRQLLTLVETHTFGTNAVNEVRLGANRIHITFTPAFQANPVDFGISNGVTTAIGLPSISISSLGLNFGGPAGEPQGRGDTLYVLSDTYSWLHGNHAWKFGGEYRHFMNSNFAGDTGTFVFSTLNNFLADHVSSFAVTPGTKPSRVAVNALGGYAVDSWKVTKRLTAELGFRFEWNGTPTEALNRLVIFQPSSASLVQVGSPGLGSVYGQNYNYEPRLGFAWDVTGKGETILHAGYGILYNQPETNLVTPLSVNPPFAVPVSLVTGTPSAALTMQNAFSQAQASKSIAPTSVQSDFRNPQTQSYNIQLEQRLGDTLGFKLGYMGSKGTHLQMLLNLNQPVVGVRPYAALSLTSPIDPGLPLTNIYSSASVSNSNYNAGFVTVNKSFANSLQFSAAYTWSKANDYNSYSFAATSQVPQDSKNPRGDYGPSDFDTRSHFSLSGVYDLPFHNNRLVDGWEISTITVLQTGNPFTVNTLLANNGTVGRTRPNQLGPVPTSHALASNGNVQYIPQAICNAATTGCLFSSPGTGFGNMRRNAIYYPGLQDVDVGLQKQTKITEKLNLNLRTDFFNAMNHANLGQPNAFFSPGGAAGTFGQISATRFPIGDFGSSRQMQVSAKLVF
ncbi:MAG: carboxypeptidase-like regulatory domain-containing protein [Terracidiphilus sp.]